MKKQNPILKKRSIVMNKWSEVFSYLPQVDISYRLLAHFFILKTYKNFPEIVKFWTAIYFPYYKIILFIFIWCRPVDTYSVQ